MSGAARTIGLYAPPAGIAAVAAGVVLAALAAPRVLVGLAVLTLALCVAAAALAVALAVRTGAHAHRRRPVSLRGRTRDPEIRRALGRVGSDPEDVGARRDLARHLGDIDGLRREADRLHPRNRETVLRVLREVGAVERVQRAADGEGRWERVAAARNLAWLAPPDVVWRLDELARDPDADVALAGSTGLAGVAESAAYRALVRLLGDGPLPASRVAVLLEESAWTDPVPVLAQEVPGASATVRFWAAYLAGRSGDPAAIPLLTRLAADADADVRASAAEALGRFPAVVCLGLLLQLSSDEVWYVRAHAATSLGSVASPAGDAGAHLGALPTRIHRTRTQRAAALEVVPRLVVLLSDRSWWVREDAARALGRIGEPAIPALRRALASDDRFARNKAAEVLVGLGFVEREMAAYLAGRRTRARARNSLILLARAEVLSSITARLMAAGEDQRRELGQALRELDDARLSPTLRMLLELPEPPDEPRRRSGRRGAERRRGDE
jgi:HEAT repeat protein